MTPTAKAPDKTKLLLYQRLAASMKICSFCETLSFREVDYCPECNSNRFFIDDAKLEERVAEMYEMSDK